MIDFNGSVRLGEGWIWKSFLKRDYAEKFVDLNTGDKISVTGVVFSNALGDSWVEVDNITILEKAPKEDEE